MNSRRIKVDVDNIVSNNIKIKLEQNVKEYEILSLKLNESDIYQSMNADFGILIGRVSANGRVGVPNAKISIFIPIDETDKINNEIYANYPYEKPTDLNEDGKRYNLLPRVSRLDTNDNVNKPKQAFGSFPLKEEIIVNETLLTIYEKYYKFSTVSNNSGDYMISGVPIGTQTVHMSVDITDIGEYSMNPAAMVTNLGYSENLFQDNNTKIKESNDLDELPHIETQEIAVDIIPFWGDKDLFEIGITRQDFKIRAKINKTFVLFGSAFTDKFGRQWGDNYDDNQDEARELYYAGSTDAKRKDLTSIGTKRIANVTEKIYYYPNTITDDDIDNNVVDPRVDMMVLNKSEYTIHKRDGDFVFIINCNRKKVITNDFGEKIAVDDSDINGIYTEFRGFVTIEITSDDASLDWTDSIGNDVELKPFRYKVKIPQYAYLGETFREDESITKNFENTQNWRRQHYTFQGGEFYSVAKFHGLVYNKEDDDGNFDNNEWRFFINGSTYYDKLNRLIDPDWNTGIIVTSNRDNVSYENEFYNFPNNSEISGIKIFGGNWLNFSLYLTQFATADSFTGDINNVKCVSNFTADNKSYHFLRNNNQDFVANETNTKFFARSDFHLTDIIRTSVSDLLKMYNTFDSGFAISDLSTYDGEYKNGNSFVPVDRNNIVVSGGGKIDLNPNGSVDSKYYFYRGFGEADCIGFLKELNLI